MPTPGSREFTPELAAAPDYLALIQDFPLKTIHSENELDRAITAIDALLDKGELSTGKQDYLDVLSVLVEDFERSHVEIPPVSGVEALRHLMEANGLTQSELAPLFGGKSVISEVLSGKRRLSQRHITTLSPHFGLPAGVFLHQD